MTSYTNESTLFALQILDLLIEKPVSGVGLQEVTKKMNSARTTTHRTLKTLEVAGWVEQIKTNSRSVNWKVSSKFLKAAFTYRQAAQSELQRVQQEYLDLTGEELSYD